MLYFSKICGHHRLCPIFSPAISHFQSPHNPKYHRPKDLLLNSTNNDSSNDIPSPPFSNDNQQQLLDAFGLPDSTMARSLGLNESYLELLMGLPGTTTMLDLKTRLISLAQWNTSLRKGVLPKASEVDWPQEPFRSKFIDVLKKLELPRFTRRHPQLLASLLKQFLELVDEFEGELKEQEGKSQSNSKSNQRQQLQQKQQPPPSSSSKADPEPNEQEEGEGGEGDNPPPPDQQDDASSSQQQQQSESGPGGSNEEGDDQESEIQMELQDVEGSQGENNNNNDDDKEEGQSSLDQSGQQGKDGDGEEETERETAERIAEKIANRVIKDFEEDWAPAMDALQVAEAAFDNIDGLIDGPEGFDSSSAVWKASGWQELDKLRKKLEVLKELRELVRSLGRGGGRGPLKRAPELVYASASPQLGVLRSELSPEETRGLTRSGDLSRMLPFEAHLLAAGWPKDQKKNRESAGGDGSSSSRSEEENNKKKEGSRAARLLFMVRRAERALMSYERAGWTDDQPSRATGRTEIRPSAELGPIIVCLDTSGSMYGARETVAKALALECMRGAARQGRKCYLYAFSGPGDVAELELGTDDASVLRLLKFLSMSFQGGTDVDAPLALSLERLKQQEWALSDILMVTDGEIPQPNEDILEKLGAAHEELGLEVHGLLVGRNVTEPMKALCTKLHVFKSWSAVSYGDSRFM